MSLNTKHSVYAFTLVEVLVVLVILMLLAQQAWTAKIATWFSQTQYEQLALSQQSLARGLLLARQYAVQANQTVSLCGGDHQYDNCDGDWSSGWYIESNESIKTYHLFPSTITIVWSGFPSTKKQIDFYENGHSGYQNGTFYLCQFALITRIVVNQSGRFYLGDINETSELAADCE